MKGPAFVLFVLASLVYNAQSTPVKPCLFEQTGHYIMPGETYNPVNIGACISGICRADGLAVVTCGLVDARCKNASLIPEDFSKPYPECCGKVLCG